MKSKMNFKVSLIFVISFIVAALLTPTPALATDCSPRPNANLSGCDFTSRNLNGIDLSGADLSYSILRDANLNAATLVGADLSNSDLAGAQMKYANLSEANLNGSEVYGTFFWFTNFSGANLAGIWGGADYLGANFAGTNLGDGTLIGVLSNIRSGNTIGHPTLPNGWSLKSGYLIGPNADLSNVNFGTADFTDTNFYATNLTGSNLSSAILTGAKSGSIGGSPSLPSGWILKRGYLIGPGANLQGATFSGDDLRLADFRGVISGGISGIDSRFLPTNWIFKGGYLIGPGANLTGANLTGLSISAATLRGVRSGGVVGAPTLPSGWVLLNGYLVGPEANLDGADLYGQNLSNLNIRGASLNRTDLRGANMSNIESGLLTGNPVLSDGWSVFNGYLVGSGANLGGADLQNINLSNRNLSNVNFTYANLSDANLEGLKSSNITGWYATFPENWYIYSGHLIGPGANLSETDLTNISLSGKHIENVNFRGANLTGADFRSSFMSGIRSGSITGNPTLPYGWGTINGYLVGPGANLTNADIGQGSLSGISLAGANLAEANFIQSDLSNVSSGSISGTPLLPQDWIFRNGYLIGPKADLTGADLGLTDLSSAHLFGVKSGNVAGSPTLPPGWLLKSGFLIGPGVDLGQVDLRQDNLTGVTSGEVTGNPLLQTGWKLINGYILGPRATLGNADLHDQTLLGINLDQTDLSGVDLRGVKSGEILGSPILPAGWSVRGGYLIGPGANLSDADLRNANLSGVQSGSIVGTPVLPSGWSVRGGYLIGPGANLSGAELRNADLSGVQSGLITGTPNLPTGWILSAGYLIGPGANLSGANLGNSNLSRATLSSVTSGGVTGSPILPERWTLRGGYLIGPGANLGSANLASVDLSGVSSGGVTGTPILPSGWYLRGGYLIGPGANLDGANLSGLNLSSINFGFSTLIGANLNDTNLTDCYLSDALTASLTGTPVLPPNWRLTNGVLVGLYKFPLSPNPLISGAVNVGKIVTADTGTWSPTGVTFRYQWLADGESIWGATSKTFVITSNQLGKQLQVRITAEKTNYNTTIRLSTPSTPVGASLFSIKPAPTISGASIVGSILTATSKPWSPSANLTLTWYADGVSLNATGNTLMLGPSEVGKIITVRATGSQSGYVTETISSSGTAAVQWPVIPKVSSAKIVLAAGSRYAFGSTLGVNTGTWTSGVSFRYQWLRNGSPITGATNSTYEIRVDDVSRKISVVVTGVLDGYRNNVSTSPATLAIAKKTLTSLGSPVITGNPVVGYTLATQGLTWLPGVDSYTYIWYRNGKAIKGATDSTYIVQIADKGTKISVAITGHQAGCTDLTKTSSSTSKVTS